MKKLLALACMLLLFAFPAQAEELASYTRIAPAYPVPDYVSWLLEIAAEEVGYTEGDHGWSKYGEWVSDPYTQWCAEYLCWCVDQVDQRHGTKLLRQVYPMYSGSNTGKNWFIQQGRYLVRWGNLENWGYQWLKGESSYISTGDYIPQPGDWVFFTWDSDQDTDHVAMVEYCTRDQHGNVKIHVLEGNAPSAVQRNVYDLTYTRILGYGTVHDVLDVTMRYGNQGVKVQQLQEKLVYLGYLDAGKADGLYGAGTADAIRAFQADHGLKTYGVANITTQKAIDFAIDEAIDNDPLTWTVIDE